MEKLRNIKTQGSSLQQWSYRHTSLPFTSNITEEWATVPSLFLASQEYSPLSSSTTSVITSLLFLSFNRVSITARSFNDSPSFFHVMLTVSLLTLQVNVRTSPAVSVWFVTGTTWAEAFPTLGERKLIKKALCHLEVTAAVSTQNKLTN